MEEALKQRRILIVDDTTSNITILDHVLADYKRLVATNGAKALEMALAEPSPDLILLDVMMPGMDGFEVFRRLQADPRTREIPVIFVTALAGTVDETGGLEMGAVDYITKPIRPTVVRARVRTHLCLKQAQEALREKNLDLEHKVAERSTQLRQAFVKLKEASLETIYRLSRSAEYRDDDTGAHVQRMSLYSAAVARALGIGEEDAERLLYAAPMHDIGKIGIPDRILLKPGKLDDEEWEIMRSHSKIGADILSGSYSDVIKLGEEVALTHHERWDGSGYPQRLQGEAIPMVGRIVAIADVFDALTSERPYKRAFSIEKSHGIIREERGRHFDPDVVDAFFSIEDEILEIKDRYQDSRPSHLHQVSGSGG